MKTSASGSAARATLAAMLVIALSGCSGGGGPAAEQGGTSASDREPDTSGREPGAGDREPDTGTASGGTDQALAQTEISRRIFSPAVTDFVVHAFHEAGAEPYVGRLGLTADDTWDITAQSYRDLFAAHRGRSLTVPSTLERMQGFADQGIQSWSVAALAALGDSLAPPLAVGERVNVSILFVNGLFEGNDGVLGLHLPNTHYAFVFKDVVESVGGGAMTQRYVEQATVVHELGHAIGFVGSGVPMVNAHEDADHPHHTTNRDGVMYWAVESKDGVLAFLTDAVTGARLSLFGAESLLDAQNFMPDD